MSTKSDSSSTSPSRVAFKAKRGIRRILSSILRLGFDPPPEVEPELENERPEKEVAGREETPVVLTKLQKWGDYPAIGQPLGPTQFLPMKTPMSKEILASWSLPQPCKHPLTVERLLCDSRGAGLKVGAIIDLANHDCLYTADIPDDLEHIMIQLVAKVTPSREAVNQVVAAAGAFWEEHPDQYIAIHCAYGFNRTGFVLCSYLCQVLGMSVEEALETFAQARPPGVRHAEFVKELHRRYGDNDSRRSASGNEAMQQGAVGASASQEVDTRVRCSEETSSSIANPLPPLAPGAPRFPRGSIVPSAGPLSNTSRAPSVVASSAASVDSEMHSLGFGTREALRQLREQDEDSPGKRSAVERLSALFLADGNA